MANLPIGSGWHNRKARLITATLALLQSFAGTIEGYMKGQAPWTDQTSLARGGLIGEVRVEQKATTTRLAVGLAHSMDYGKWLETVNGPGMGSRAGMSADQLADASMQGNFATIHPSADVYGPQIQTQVKTLWGRP